MLALTLLVFFANLLLLVQVSQGFQNWYFLLSVGLFSCGLILVFLWRFRRRKVVCCNCSTELTVVSRPLTLNYDDLARKGIIVDGTFFALRNHWPRKKEWMKLSRWTRACHQCKLLEEKHFLKFVSLQTEELEAFQRALALGEEQT